MICKRNKAKRFDIEKANRVIATLKNNDNKWMMAEYSDGEVWGTNPSGSEKDVCADFTYRVLKRMIDEKLFKKTEKNLSSTQWAVMLFWSKKDPAIDKQIVRFVEILNEENK